ncbi:hypothetical protein CBR_g38546 [Chara braunii]|uniref:SMC hinge domain-containing protein n=1 Tax=Chara braunii TaxID=69332 RepID=A0A388JP20_CHABU|nr:hypothetical protein CBR_g38546 [Chara braunii]|eukprot:GBG59523.1 hypothetical protein CBR_g38546 [Chara braunii]
MPAMMKTTGSIHRIEVENFKSYKGHQVIGPFRNFTAIIGPNGSGKSNLMDAISFVLGVRSMQLRGSQLKDLIYTENDSVVNPLRRAYVKLVYRNGNGSGEELTFTRTITAAGSCEYRINERVASWDDYNAKMKSLGILLKARNFLVFQGDVESIAAKNPKELTAMFEQISGSEELRKSYEELEEQKKRAEERTMLAYQKKRSMVSERKQKKEQRDEAEKHLELVKKLKELRRENYLFQLFHIDKDIGSLMAEIETDNGDLREVAKAQYGVENAIKEKKKQQAVYMKKILDAERNIGRKKTDLDKKVNEMGHKKEAARYDVLKAKVEDIDNQLREAKADRRENERDVKMNAAIESLKRLFPGVRGRITELCRPTQRRYNLAVSIALGRNMDAIVVDDEKTARDCIQYLKEQRLSSMTFIPLQTIKIKPVQERMRTLGGTSKLVIDVIQFDPAYERAFIYACGNTLVCDGLDEAKRLGWGPERAKVVALDGTLIHKSGMMTGGLSGGMEAKAQRWDDQAVESMRN